MFFYFLNVVKVLLGKICIFGMEIHSLSYIFIMVIIIFLKKLYGLQN